MNPTVIDQQSPRIKDQKDSLVKAKILIKGKLVTTSPFLIGKGKGDELDMELMVDDNGKPYIPGSSFAGMFAHYFRKYANINSLPGLEQSAKQFFGTTEKDENYDYQSHFAIEELIIADPFTVSIRDGVEILTDTGIAKQGSKYDYEVLEAGAEFDFEAEITLRKNFDETNFLAIIKTLKEEGEKENLRTGAFTSFGFGKWKWGTFNTYYYHFPSDHLGWFALQQSRFSTTPVLKQAYDWADFDANSKIQLKRDTFSIRALFEIKNSLIVGHYATGSDEADKTHITGTNGSVLPGKSIKGAIKLRAKKIVASLGKDKAGSIIDDLMGKVNLEKEKKVEDHRSRLQIEEAIITGAATNQVQPRVNIDRFTGGAMEQGLFDSRPLWHQQEGFEITFIIDKPQDYEQGLLLLLLKDLWTADLPIGGEKNIGRGVLKGKQANIYVNEELITSIVQEDKKLILNPKVDLEKFVEALLNMSYAI